MSITGHMHKVLAYLTGQKMAIMGWHVWICKRIISDSGDTGQKRKRSPWKYNTAI